MVDVKIEIGENLKEVLLKVIEKAPPSTITYVLSYLENIIIGSIKESTRVSSIKVETRITK